MNAWLVVFVLPINSALNPVIYTIAAPTEVHHRLYKHYRRISGDLKRRITRTPRDARDASNDVEFSEESVSCLRVEKPVLLRELRNENLAEK